MSTIASLQTSSSGLYNYPQDALSQSLASLSTRTQSAAAAAADLGEAPDAADIDPTAIGQIALQNQLSALADPAEAAAANAATVAVLGSSPSAALAAQGSPAPETALGLLS